MIDRIAPTVRPKRVALSHQKWRSLLFLHWELPVDSIQRLLPKGLTVDTFEGRAYVGIVAFTMRDVRPAFAPPIPPLSNFDEINLRTYVHFEGRHPGVWFFSLDAASSFAVAGARTVIRLPYHRARMSMEQEGPLVRYASERLWPGPTPASFRARWEIGAPRGSAEPGTFEHFLVERYILYTDLGPLGVRMGRVHHRAYRLHGAELLELEEDLLTPAGLPKAEGAPHVLFSPGVDVEIFRLERP